MIIRGDSGFMLQVAAPVTVTARPGPSARPGRAAPGPLRLRGSGRYSGSVSEALAPQAVTAHSVTMTLLRRGYRDR